MASILDTSPFPWPLPEAQQLHTTLTQIHPTSQDAMFISQKAGLNVGMIFFSQPPAFLWKDILERAAIDGLTRVIVKEVRDRLNPNSPLRPFLDGLLANQTVRSEGEPRAANGAPMFLANDDEVKEPEALLYRDDLTVQIGRVPALIATLQRLVELAPTVCKLIVDVHGLSKYGTAFRIGPDLLLTNWHVLHNTDNKARATVVTAEFGYEDDGKGGVITPTAIPCDVTSIVTSEPDDWAIIRAQQPLSNAWPIVKLSESAPPTLSAAAYVIQHPGGDRKRVGFVRNQVSFFDNRVVHYLTDTQAGSSGAPVFDGDGRLIALHHAGGRPQEVVGRPPIRKNEGIRISRIVDGLSAQGINVP